MQTPAWIVQEALVKKKKWRKMQTPAFSSVSKPTLSLSVFDDLKIKILFPLGV